ncbi:MAG TPA: adenine deaminase C-terminal domain-containing protein [Syntrophorhabdaceae bacterium]|nr:adenine deaminase C-terminal domain-containing protein [Syntrophorhabdaceae bacterium]
MNRQTITTLLNVVKGTVPPDAIITNGKIVNVFTNSIDEGFSLIIKDGYIASVEENALAASYKSANVIDARGLYLCPGFIDAHTHVDGIYSFSEFVPYAIRGGTTTVVTETSATSCAAGMEGLRAYMEGTRGYPLRCFFLAPPLTPPFPRMENSLGLTLREFSAMLKRDDVVGIGEAYWTRIVGGDKRILSQAAYALSLNKRLDGHSAGARGKRLIEYILTGITSCHESINVDEVMEKLRSGLYIMIREGFVRQELPELSKLKDMTFDKRRLMLVSDFFDAVMLSREGYLDSIVRKAIRYGFSPMEAIKMVTINPADYYGMRYLGAIAPLRYADMLFLSDLDRVAIEKVMAGGEIVWESGKFLKAIKPHQYPLNVQKTITTKHVSEDDFKIKARGKRQTIRVIEIVNPTITKEVEVKTTVSGGYLEKDLSNDIIPVAVINKRKPAQRGRGFIRGTGIKNGAVATTVIWDTGNILTIGSHEKDMEVAVNRLIDMQGGIVIARDGKVVYELPMPLFGIMSRAPIEEIARKTEELERTLQEIGASLARPFLNIQTIPFTGLPFLRISDKGLVDVKKKKLVSIFVKDKQG